MRDTNITRHNKIVILRQPWQELSGGAVQATGAGSFSNTPICLHCRDSSVSTRHAQHRLMHARQSGSLLRTCTVRAALLAMKESINTSYHSRSALSKHNMRLAGTTWQPHPLPGSWRAPGSTAAARFVCVDAGQRCVSSELMLTACILSTQPSSQLDATTCMQL